MQIQDSIPDNESLIVLGRTFHLHYGLFDRTPVVQAWWEQDGRARELRGQCVWTGGPFADLRQAAIKGLSREAQTDERCNPYLERLKRAELGMEEHRREALLLGAWEWNNTLARFICDARYSVVNEIRSSSEPEHVLEEFLARARAVGVSERALKGFPLHGPDPS